MLPLDDRVAERLSADVSGRPQLVTGTRQRLYAGMGRLSEHSVVSIKNVSHAVTAEITVPAENAQGVIIAQGGSIGGWSLYVKDGRLRYCYNLFGVQRFYVGAERALAEGLQQVRMEFAYDGPGLGKGGTVSLFVGGEQGGRGKGGRDRGDDLLRRRHLRRGQGGRRARGRRLPDAPTTSPARCTGSRSTSGTTPRTRITSSPPTSCSGSPWPVSELRASEHVAPARTPPSVHRRGREDARCCAVLRIVLSLTALFGAYYLIPARDPRAGSDLPWLALALGAFGVVVGVQLRRHRAGRGIRSSGRWRRWRWRSRCSC